MSATKQAAPKPDSPATPSPARRPAPRRSWTGRILIALVVAVPLLGWLAPQIVSQFATQPDMLRVIAPELPENLRIGKASLSWQAPILLRDVSLQDDEGQSLFNIDAVTSEQTLWDLVKNAQLPLTLHFEGLEATIVVPSPSGESKFNADEAAQAFAEALESSGQLKIPAVKRPLDIHLQDGTLTFVNGAGDVLSRYQPIVATCHLASNTKAAAPDAAPERSSLDLTLPVAVPTGEGRCTLQANWNFAAGTNTIGDAQSRLELVQIPVDPLQPLLGSVLEGGTLTGLVDGVATSTAARNADGLLSGELGVQLGKDDPSQPDRLFVMRDGQLPAPFFLQSARGDFAIDLDPEQQHLAIRRGELATQPLDLSVSGAISDLTGRVHADVAGKIRTDAQQFFALLPESVRKEIALEGLQLTGFALRGPLRPAAVSPAELAEAIPMNPPADPTAVPPPPEPPVETLSLQATVGWTRAAAYGLDAAAGELRISLLHDRLKLEPLGVVVNEGKLLALPAIDLNSQSTDLICEPAILLEEINLTEELCRGWLRYISPITADATSVNGKLSLATGDGRLPLDDMSRGQLQGVLVVHEGALGAGPLVQPIMNLVEQVQGIAGIAGGRPLANDLRLDLQPQQVAYELRDGRVYHSNLSFKAGEVTLTSSGSVGLDDSLDMKLQITMPDRWFENRGPVLSSLQGEVIEVGIGGTLDRPRVDPRPLADFGTRIGAKAAGGLLNDLINRGIERGIQRRQQRGR